MNTPPLIVIQIELSFIERKGESVGEALAREGPEIRARLLVKEGLFSASMDDECRACLL